MNLTVYLTPILQLNLKVFRKINMTFLVELVVSVQHFLCYEINKELECLSQPNPTAKSKHFRNTHDLFDRISD